MRYNQKIDIMINISVSGNNMAVVVTFTLANLQRGCKDLHMWGSKFLGLRAKIYAVLDVFFTF